MAEANRVIKEFLFARMYRHWRVNRMTAKARRVTERDLSPCCTPTPALLPDDWRARAGEGRHAARGGDRCATTSPA